VLSPYRVLDLTTERGLLCGQMLADLGADVIKVEPPGGSLARRLGPFVGDEPHPERSLVWWAYNRNKRGITLDLEQGEGQQLLRRLAAHADFLIESDAPGTLAARRLGPADLAAVNSRLIYISISPFGQTGPKAHDAASDLATEARFATAEGRRAHQDALDEHDAAWSRRQDAHAAERALQARGVPASAVQNSRDLLADPQLAARGHFVRLTHPTRGSTMVEGSRFRLSRTPAQMPTAAPTLGRDTADVLRSLLGYGDARIAELEAAGVLA